MKVRISADSTCDLGPELTEKYQVTIAPLSVIIDGQSYKDGVDVTPEAIFSAVEHGKKVQTAAVNQFEYQELFSELLKDGDEIELVRRAVDITRRGLEYVMKTLKPGMMEYEAQADFEYTCRRLGAVKLAFGTIAGSGKNGCMMHYVTNRDEIRDGSLLLLDLGLFGLGGGGVHASADEEDAHHDHDERGKRDRDEGKG